MKHNYYLVSLLSAIIFLASCSNVDYKKSKSGLLYKIIRKGNSNDPIAKPGNVIKLNFIPMLSNIRI